MKTDQKDTTKELITIPVKAETTLEDTNRIIEKNRASLRSHVQAKLQEYGMSLPVCDLRYGLFSISGRNPYDEIINIANGIQCALADGWFFFFEAERLRRELAELKGRRVEVAECKVLNQE